MQISISTLASWVQGRIEGDPNALISNVGKIEEAKPGDIAFLANEKYEKFLYSTQATAVLVSNSLEFVQNVAPSTGRFKTNCTAREHARACFAALVVVCRFLGFAGVPKPVAFWFRTPGRAFGNARWHCRHD